MANMKTFEFIYHSGESDGIISISDSDHRFSTMTAYVIPRTRLSDTKGIKGIDRHGIYYLIGESNEDKIAQIYIGHTTQGISRIYTQDRAKGFWDKAILFLDEKKPFSSDVIKGLEKYAIEKALASKLYTLDNVNTPQLEIDEDDLHFIEKKYKEIQFIMEALGYRMSAHTMNGKKNEAAEIFYASRKGRGIKACGTYDGNTFLLLEGSEVDFENPANAEIHNSRRKELLKKGDIVQQGGKYILKKPLPFNWPSGASMFVFGNNINGWNEWKREDGKTLDEVYRKK